MTYDPPRDREQRKQDTLAKLTADNADVWVSTASPAGEPYLVPLSLAWLGERAVIAVDGSSRTARNLAAGGTARLAVGATRDVVLIDAVLERAVPALEAGELAEGYAAQADWDPRTGGGESYRYLVLRPERIQAWREVNELSGRLLMKGGEWL